jgi:hypothetical protein
LRIVKHRKEFDDPDLCSRYNRKSPPVFEHPRPMRNTVGASPGKAYRPKIIWINSCDVIPDETGLKRPLNAVFSSSNSDPHIYCLLQSVEVDTEDEGNV